MADNTAGKHTITHDQNFKNLILDYPRRALEFFATEEAGDMTPEVRITPVRQEQTKDRVTQTDCSRSGSQENGRKVRSAKFTLRVPFLLKAISQNHG